MKSTNISNNIKIILEFSSIGIYYFYLTLLPIGRSGYQKTTNAQENQAKKKVPFGGKKFSN